MFIPVHARVAAAYRQVDIQSKMESADPHALVALLYSGLLQAVGGAKLAIQADDIEAKNRAIGKATRILEEGLKAGLNPLQGGELAANLRSLYDYCIMQLIKANLQSDGMRLDEVIGLIEPLAEAWNSIKPVSAPLQMYVGKSGV